MAAGAWPSVVAGLIDGMRAKPGYRHPYSSSTGVPVYDGIEIGVSEDDVTTYILIGIPSMDGAGNVTAELAGSAEQTPGPFSPTRPRDEKGEVRCLAVYQTGDAPGGSTTDMTARTVRNAAFAALATVEALCREDVNISASCQWAFVTSYEVRQWLDDGAICEIEFVVSYYARI